MLTKEHGTLQDFVTANRISMTADRVAENPNNKDWKDADHWKVVITRKWTSSEYHERGTGKSVRYTRENKLTTYFSMGYGHNGKAPDVADVLDCLASDSASVEQSSFEDWANDLGYDSDSRKAEKIYKACEHGAARLKRFLGDELYERLLYQTERL